MILGLRAIEWVNFCFLSISHNEVVIGDPVSFKNKDFWIPVFTGKTANVVLQGLLQEPLFLEIAARIFMNKIYRRDIIDESNRFLHTDDIIVLHGAHQAGKLPAFIILKIN